MRDTRQRVLESACEVFAEKGYQDAKVGDICAQADANIAAVNYHFGSKRKLYVEVLRYAAACADRDHPLACEDPKAQSAKKRLEHFIHSHFARTFSDGISGCFPKLLVHEVTNPTFAHESVFRELLHPEMLLLEGIVGELLPEEVPAWRRRLYVANVIGLCAFFQFSEPARRHAMLIHAEQMDEFVRHTTEFALAGIRSVRKSIQETQS